MGNNIEVRIFHTHANTYKPMDYHQGHRRTKGRGRKHCVVRGEVDGDVGVRGVGGSIGIGTCTAGGGLVVALVKDLVALREAQ